MLQYVNGREGSICSAGRSLILWPSRGLLSLRQVTHWWMNEATVLLIPGIQKPIGSDFVYSEAFSLMLCIFVVMSYYQLCCMMFFRDDDGMLE